jgi:uncharacterized ferritin-like protein (DUF455 family)
MKAKVWIVYCGDRWYCGRYLSKKSAIEAMRRLRETLCRGYFWVEREEA